MAGCWLQPAPTLRCFAARTVQPVGHATAQVEHMGACFSAWYCHCLSPLRPCFSSRCCLAWRPRSCAWKHQDLPRAGTSHCTALPASRGSPTVRRRPPPLPLPLPPPPPAAAAARRAADRLPVRHSPSAVSIAQRQVDRAVALALGRFLYPARRAQLNLQLSMPFLAVSLPFIAQDYRSLQAVRPCALWQGRRRRCEHRDVRSL